jgi:hypothetical protein
VPPLVVHNKLSILDEIRRNLAAEGRQSLASHQFIITFFYKDDHRKTR